MFEVFDDVKKGKYERNMVTKTGHITKAALEKVAGPLEIKGNIIVNGNNERFKLKLFLFTIINLPDILPIL